MSTRTAVRYEDDVYTWSQQQAAALRRAAQSRVNLPTRSTSRTSPRRSRAWVPPSCASFYSRYAVLLMHLLKWQYQPEKRTPSWGTTIRTQRRDIAKLLKTSPGLKPKRPAELAEAYAADREDASGETGLAIETFPIHCPWALHQVEDSRFWPEPARNDAK